MLKIQPQGCQKSWSPRKTWNLTILTKKPRTLNVEKPAKASN